MVFYTFDTRPMDMATYQGVLLLLSVPEQGYCPLLVLHSLHQSSPSWLSKPLHLGNEEKTATVLIPPT